VNEWKVKLWVVGASERKCRACGSRSEGKTLGKPLDKAASVGNAKAIGHPSGTCLKNRRAVTAAAGHRTHEETDLVFLPNSRWKRLLNTTARIKKWSQVNHVSTILGYTEERMRSAKTGATWVVVLDTIESGKPTGDGIRAAVVSRIRVSRACVPRKLETPIGQNVLSGSLGTEKCEYKGDEVLSAIRFHGEGVGFAALSDATERSR